MRSLTTFLLVICGVVGTKAWCSREDAEIVMDHWLQATGAAIGGDQMAVIQPTTYFFVRLMDLYPATKALLGSVNVDNVNSPEFQAHSLRVAKALDICVNSLRDPPLLEKITSHLASQHSARHGITAAHFDLFSQQVKGDLFYLVDNFHADAWDNCFTPIMKAIAAHLP